MYIGCFYDDLDGHVRFFLVDGCNKQRRLTLELSGGVAVRLERFVSHRAR